MKQWRKQWSEYQEWAEAHSGTDPRSPVAIARDVDWLYANLPEHVRITDPDPEKLGIQEMYRIFGLYERKRQSLRSTLAQAVENLNQVAVPYMLIGGLALSVWAIPRATLDIDLTLWVDAGDFERVCHQLASRYHARTDDPLGFAQKMRVLPVANEAGVRLDFLFAAFPFEKVMIDRAVVRSFGAVEVRVATLEDLILLKLPSARSKDREDIRSILQSYSSEAGLGLPTLRRRRAS